MRRIRYGALPDFHIRRLIEQEHITNVDSTTSAIQPASLDLTLGDRIYKTKGAALVRRNEHMQHYRKALGATDFSFDDPLERDTTYLIELRERISLPQSVYGYVNPKSSTGRIDLHTRLIVNGKSIFDGVDNGYEGAIWVLVTPKSFRVKIQPGISLNQMRFFTEDTRFTRRHLEIENRKRPLVWDTGMQYPIPLDQVAGPGKDGVIVASADLSSNIVGWRAKKTDEVLDLSRRDADPSLFWESAVPEGEMLFMEKDSFWILSTKEAFVVPPGLSAEVVAMNERYMEGRTHSAGFIDPGWGWNSGNGRGDTITMEVRPFENMYLRNGLPFAGLRYERMLEVPEKLYGAGSHYAGQKLAALAKFFAPFSAAA